MKDNKADTRKPSKEDIKNLDKDIQYVYDVVHDSPLKKPFAFVYD